MGEEIYENGTSLKIGKIVEASWTIGKKKMHPITLELEFKGPTQKFSIPDDSFTSMGHCRDCEEKNKKI